MHLMHKDLIDFTRTRLALRRRCLTGTSERILAYLAWNFSLRKLRRSPPKIVACAIIAPILLLRRSLCGCAIAVSRSRNVGAPLVAPDAAYAGYPLRKSRLGVVDRSGPVVDGDP